MSDSPIRADGRSASQLRRCLFKTTSRPMPTARRSSSGGNTRVICGVTIEESVPRWMKEQKVEGGWLTAEYSMLPYSTLTRKPRDISKGKLDGRSSEIQRLIGSRQCARRLIWKKSAHARSCVDCDVLQADGGTRTAAITGSFRRAFHRHATTHRQWQAQGKSHSPRRHRCERRHRERPAAAGFVLYRGCCRVGGHEPRDEFRPVNSSSCKATARKPRSAKNSSPTCSRSANRESKNYLSRKRKPSPKPDHVVHKTSRVPKLNPHRSRACG